MPRIKALSDVYTRPESINRESQVFLKLHIINNQIERLMYNKQKHIEQINHIDSILENLRVLYTSNKKAIKLIEEKNATGSKTEQKDKLLSKII